MAYSKDGKRSNASHRSQGRVGDSRGRQGSVTSRPSRPAQARGGSPSQYRNSRGYSTSRNSGSLNLQQHNIRFNNRHGSIFSEAFHNPRLLIALIAGVILLVICVFGLAHCVRGCTTKRSEPAPANTLDARVAGGISEDLTKRFTEELDRGEAMANIAANADKVGDERLLELALAEPDAIPFVAAFANEQVPRGAKRYEGDVSRGSYPKLYNWDEGWGYVTYGNGVMGITGSGPTCLAMAYIGLQGKNDMGPVDFAELSAKDGGVNDTYDTTPQFFVDHAAQLGLEMDTYTPTNSDLNEIIDSGIVVLIQLKAGTFGKQAHWALAVSENLDGSINLYDPTSTANTERSWAVQTVVSSSDTFIAVYRAPDAEEDTESTEW